MKILFDTNSYGELIQGDKKIRRSIKDADIVYFSVIVMGELLSGFEKGTKIEENLQKLNEFLSEPNLKFFPAWP